MTKHVYGSSLNDPDGSHNQIAWEEYQEFNRLYKMPVSEFRLKGGYPDDNPKTSVGATKLPLDLAPPSALHALAAAFADGAKKYGPYNWREKTISSSVYYAAAMRHLMAWWDGEDLAQDSGQPHLGHALACIAMIIDGQSVGKLNDNRPFPGAASRMQEAWLNKKTKDGTL